MKTMARFKDIINSHNDCEITQLSVDYEGISKVLSNLTELYKVCENKALLDKCLHSLFFNQTIIAKKNND